jgi:hypothetical protein
MPRSLTALLAATLFSCGESTPSAPPIAAPPEDAALRFDVLTRAQAGAEREYAFDADGSALHPESGLAGQVDDQGRLRLGAGDSRSIELESWGRPGAETPVPARRRDLRGNRAEIDRGAIRESFIHGPLGIQQTFQIPERPHGSGELNLVLALGGMQARAGEDSVVLSDPDGPYAQVGETYVRDRHGRMLPAELAAEGGRLRIRIDDRDAAYPLQVDPIIALFGWRLVATISPGLLPATEFGFSVDIRGVFAAIGAVNDRVDVWRRVPFFFGDLWEKIQTISPQPGAVGQFASAVSLGGGRLAIGAPSNDPMDLGTFGYVDVYEFNPMLEVFQYATTLTPSNIPDGDTSEFGFGRSLDLDGSTLIVGANRFWGGRGLAFIFEHSGLAWSQTAVLSGTPFEADVNFGNTVRVSGDTVAIGQPGAGIMFLTPGAVEIYRKVAGVWTFQQRISPNEGMDLADGYGFSLALDGNHLAVRATGIVRAYRRTAGIFGETWSEALTTGATDRQCMALSGTLLAVGRSGSNDAVLYRRQGDDSYLLEKTLASPAPGASFGRSVAADGARVIVGAPGANRAYIYRRGLNLIALLQQILDAFR